MFIVGNSDTLQSCSRVVLSEFSTIVVGEVAVREILQETLPNLGLFPRLIGKKGAVEHQVAPNRMTAR